MELREEDISLLGLLSRFWWLMLLRGLVVSLYGVLTFKSPDNAIDVSIALFGAYIILCGLLTLMLGIRSHQLAWRFSTLIVPGIISVIAAAAVVILPGHGVLIVLGIGGLWSIVVGLMEILLAIRLRRAFLHQITLLTAGLTSTFLGGSILMHPWKILLLDERNVQITALFLGVALVVLSFGMRHIEDQATEG